MWEYKLFISGMENGRRTPLVVIEDDDEEGIALEHQSVVEWLEAMHNKLNWELVSVVKVPNPDYNVYDTLYYFKRFVKAQPTEDIAKV